MNDKQRESFEKLYPSAKEILDDNGNIAYYIMVAHLQKFTEGWQAALAEQAKQEPVAWAEVIDGDIMPCKHNEPNVAWSNIAEYQTPLYTSPPNQSALIAELVEALSHYTSIFGNVNDPNDWSPKVRDAGSFARDVLAKAKGVNHE